MGDQILLIIASAATTGALSYIGNIAALKTHIKYISERQDRLENRVIELENRKSAPCDALRA